ncbi:hypothetical protein C0Q70_21107 [Pomacea canaliculata]|uniref:G-protein coupled receptors family 1 profile domain-containing protein n=1 Tax=Pomacea canaliculata TaxID=400727 RepID=A0A2T7NBM2_POMCA|nr:hypothetical protein C0Q70_21107 [Pomacea canaliculata]
MAVTPGTDDLADLNSTLAWANGSEANVAVTLPLFEAAIMAWKVASPVIILLGTIGNTLIIVVLYRSKVMSSNMTSYFLTIAVSDLMNLLVSITCMWLKQQFDIQVWTLHEALCKMTTWLNYTSNAMSTWTLVVMVTQRTLSILFPHRSLGNELLETSLISTPALREVGEPASWADL